MQRYAPGGLWADPFRQLRRMEEELNRAFGDLAAPGRLTAEYPPINLWAGESGVVVTAEIPGCPPDSIDIGVHQNTLTLRGKREAEAAGEETTFHRQERTYGSFGRTVALPFRVDPDQVKADFQNGVLTVTLPRPEADRPRRIQISQA